MAIKDFESPNYDGYKEIKHLLNLLIKLNQLDPQRVRFHLYKSMFRDPFGCNEQSYTIEII